ncbi:hypothetical protein Tco_0057743 [Tanacetum coccineum]
MRLFGSPKALSPVPRLYWAMVEDMSVENTGTSCSFFVSNIQCQILGAIRFHDMSLASSILFGKVIIVAEWLKVVYRREFSYYFRPLDLSNLKSRLRKILMALRGEQQCLPLPYKMALPPSLKTYLGVFHPTSSTSFQMARNVRKEGRVPKERNDAPTRASLSFDHLEHHCLTALGRVTVPEVEAIQKTMLESQSIRGDFQTFNIASSYTIGGVASSSAIGA